jgi:hypothetical protein
VIGHLCVHVGGCRTLVSPAISCISRPLMLIMGPLHTFEARAYAKLYTNGRTLGHGTHRAIDWPMSPECASARFLIDSLRRDNGWCDTYQCFLQAWQ